MSRHTTFIVNPAACSGRGGRRWAGLEPEVRAAFPAADVRFTTAPGHAAALASAAAATGDALVVAVGGDGTVHEVATGLLGLPAEARERVRMGVLQNGTGNDFVRGAGIPQRLPAALRLLAGAEERRFDVGALDCAPLTGDGAPQRHWFLNASDFGIGAAVVEKIERGPRWLGGKPGYLWQTLRTLVVWRNPEIELRLDDGEWEAHRIKSVALCNQPWFGGGMCAAPDAVPDDGVLACTVFGDLGRLEAMRRLGETYRGTYVEHPLIEYRACRTLEARSERRVLIEADGEVVGRLPVRYSVLPGALRIAAPSVDRGQAAQT